MNTECPKCDQEFGNFDQYFYSVLDGKKVHLTCPRDEEPEDA